MSSPFHPSSLCQPCRLCPASCDVQCCRSLDCLLRSHYWEKVVNSTSHSAIVPALARASIFASLANATYIYICTYAIITLTWVSILFAQLHSCSFTIHERTRQPPEQRNFASIQSARYSNNQCLPVKQYIQRRTYHLDTRETSGRISRSGPRRAAYKTVPY